MGYRLEFGAVFQSIRWMGRKINRIFVLLLLVVATMSMPLGMASISKVEAATVTVPCEPNGNRNVGVYFDYSTQKCAGLTANYFRPDLGDLSLWVANIGSNKRSFRIGVGNSTDTSSHNGCLLNNFSKSAGEGCFVASAPTGIHPFNISRTLPGGADIYMEFSYHTNSDFGKLMPGGSVIINDSTAPTLTSFTREEPSDSLTNADTLIFRAIFIEPVKNVTTNDFAVNGSTATVTGINEVNSFTYDITVSGGDLAGLDGTVGINLDNGHDIQDILGNDLPDGDPATDETYTIYTPPTVAISGVPAKSGLSPFTATFTFNENVQNFDLADVTAGLTNANASVFVTITNKRVFTALITPDGAGNVVVGVLAAAAQDDAGNGNVAATNHTAILDTDKPSVQILNAPIVHNRVAVFNVTFQFSEDVSNFVVGDITVANGTLSSFTIVDANTYTADITPTGPLDITIDVAGGVAENGVGNLNTAATQVTIGSTIVGDTQKVIASFMVNRANHILSNQPDLTDYVNGTNIAGGGPLGSLALNGNEGAQTLAFSTSRSKIMTEAGKRIALAFGPTDDELKSKTTDGSTNNNLKENRTGTYDIWTQINGSRSKTNTANSSTWVGYFGAHYFVSNTVLVGGLLQLDSAEETNAIPDSRAKGTGWMIGPYIAGKVTNQNIYYEARASWGRSKNEVSPIGTYTDSFKTERWMLSGKLKGAYQLDDISIEPTVRVSYFEDTQEAYRDSLANIIPEQTISLGELRFGPTISRGIKLENGTMFQPNIGIAGVWNFGMENNTIVQGLTIGRGELRARIDAGFISINTKGWTFSASGYFDGIGVDAFDSYGGKVSIVIPLN